MDSGQAWAVRVTHRDGRVSVHPQPSEWLADVWLVSVPALYPTAARAKKVRIDKNFEEWIREN